jgi:DNA repair/transcription protein MET18/MMS19
VTVGSNRKVIRDVGGLITLLVRCLDDTKQRELASGLYPFLLRGELEYLHRHSSLLSRALALPLSIKVEVLSTSASQSQRDMLYPLASALVALKKDVPGPQDDMTAYISQVLQWTLTSQSFLQEQAGAALLANGINKNTAEPCPTAFSTLLEDFWKAEIDGEERMQVDGGGGSGQEDKARLLHQKRAVRIWLVIARALLVRNSPSGLHMIERVLSLLSRASSVSPLVVKEAAKGLGKVTSQDDVLCKENGSVIRLLYKQRFVTFILPKLLDGFQQSRVGSSSSSSVHLVAICSLLPSLPKATLLEKLKEIFPLLIMALDLTEDQADESVKSSAANVITLATVIGRREKDEAISTANANIVAAGGHGVGEGMTTPDKKNSLDLVKDHISSILNRLLAILVTKPPVPAATGAGVGAGTQEAKVAALRCLAMLARSVDYPTLHPHKVKVLKTLGQKGVGVDDPKRNIRLEAVDARDAWYALKGAGEDE